MAKLKCPGCAREFVRRVSRVGPIDALLSFFYIYPFKCQLCGFRFRSLRWGVRYIRVAEDHRDYDRMPMNFPLTFEGNNLSGAGVAVDVSMRGCSFTTNVQVDGDAILKMGLQVSTDVPPVLVDAVVRHARAQSVGVEFLQWPRGERERLQLLIRGLLIERRT
jgi:hypothetical protein